MVLYEKVLRCRTYDLWPAYLGQTLRVVIASEAFEGVLLGPRPLNGEAQATDGEPPWGLDVVGRGVVFVDPQNAAVAIYASDGLIGPPQHGLSSNTDKEALNGTIARSNRISALAIEHGRALQERIERE